MAASAQASTYDSTVESYDPLAYYNLVNSDASTTVDAVHGYTMSLNNGAVVQLGAGPTINGAAAPALVLNSDNSGTAYAGSGGSNPESGGISDAGTVIAWINLANLPSTAGRVFSVAGTSASGDDFDFQIDPGSNTIDFYTQGGGAVDASTPFTSADLGQWIFVAGTFTANATGQVYINGALSNSGGTGGHSDSKNPFYIGQSNVFGGRYFEGSIADVAFYDTDLTAADIGQIYASAFVPDAVSGAPEPSTWALLLAGVGGIGLAFRQAKRRHSFTFARALAG